MTSEEEVNDRWDLSTSMMGKWCSKRGSSWCCCMDAVVNCVYCRFLRALGNALRNYCVVRLLASTRRCLRRLSTASHGMCEVCCEVSETRY